jgi:small subunit ribosomal protein S20
VARGVDHVQHVRRARLLTGCRRPGQPDVLRLDRDAALALDVHAVEVLGAHLPSLDDPRDLEHPVGQRRLPMVDVGDDAEVPDAGRIGGSGSRHSAAIVPRVVAGPGHRRGRGTDTGVGAAAATLVSWQAGPRAPAARTHCQKYSHPARHRGSRVANIKSQIKRNRTNERARQRNVAVKSALKTAVRRFRTAADAGDAAAAATALQTASRALDKAASKGVIHKNQAANRKSGMAKRVASL